MYSKWTKSIQIDTLFGCLDVSNINFVSWCKKLLTVKLTVGTSRYPNVLICMDFVHSLHI